MAQAPRRILSVALLLAATSSRASTDPAASIRASLSAMGGAFGVQTVPPPPAVPAGVPVPQAPQLNPEEALVNYEYTEMVDRLEKMSRTVIGRDKKKRRINTGVTPADRIEAGEIKYIVLHASGGATGKPGACEGSVSWLLQQKTAAHFMVCRDGRVIRMVAIENIANHVKNGEIDRTSVGIETESGQPNNRSPFVQTDWEPQSYWRMYASLAWLIRAIAKETGLPRDRAHVITHEEADRGIAAAHVDPGPFFDSANYPEFDARFPGQGVTPREFLMRLVADDLPPQIWMVPSAVSGDQVEMKDTNELGLSHIRVWSLDASGKVDQLVQEWTAPVSGMPPVTLKIDVPRLPGSYRVVARDLVGNISAALIKVAQPAPGNAPAPGPTKFSLLDLSIVRL